MDKLYSKRANFLKAFICLLLSPLYILISSIIKIDDVFLYAFFSAIPIGCLYTIPFWLSVMHLKKYRVKKIGKYILNDFAFCFSPAMLGILFSEVISAMINGKTGVDGIVTIIFLIIFTIISIIFWLLYLLFSYKK